MVLYWKVVCCVIGLENVGSWWVVGVVWDVRLWEVFFFLVFFF